MRKASHNTNGFSILELLVVTVVLAVVGGTGFFVYHRSHKTKTVASNTASHQSSTGTNNETTTKTYAATDLTNVAKQVYFQVAADGSNPPGIGTCEKQDVSSCPFTADFASKINSAQVRPSDGHILIAGVQNGPFGTAAYSATPTAQGGTVTVTVTPDASVGGGLKTWELIIVQDGGKLLVNDIQYSRAAFASTKACGPIDIYDYPSCYQ